MVTVLTLIFDIVVWSVYSNVLHMVPNSGIVKFAVIIIGDMQIVVSGLTSWCTTLKSTTQKCLLQPWVWNMQVFNKMPWDYEIHKDSGVHTGAHHLSNIHEPAFLLASLLCTCWHVGMSRPVVSGIILTTMIKPLCVTFLLLL
jgi:hypothetical protein